MEEGEDQSAAWLVSLFNKLNTSKIQNNKVTIETVLSGADTQRLKITTHKTQRETGYLNMVLNQGQR